jgi:hypothetical protein
VICMDVDLVELSVVVACGDMEGGLEECLAALLSACEGIRSEIIVVSPAGSEVAECIRRLSSPVQLILGAPDALVPELWADGWRASCGACVAFTTTHCIVGSKWARALLEALHRGATGAGGALRLRTRASLVASAVYFLRYSRFMPPITAGNAVDIPGDNAAYQRSALQRHAASFSGGFWEVDFHRRVHAEDGYLVWVPEATADFTASPSLREILRHRFLHGIHFGSYRVTVEGISRWRSLFAGPLVPFVLVSRILARVALRPADRLRAVRSMPVLFSLAVAWAAGESWGAITAGRPKPAHAIEI